MRVLIVDDDELALLVLADTLKDAGHEVQTAANGKEAIEQLRSGACRLVISDWEMPEMTGIELCRAIRADDLPGYVYVILLTGRDTPHERVEGLRAGADDFVSKPFDPAELLARVGVGERVLSLETRDVAIFAMAKLAESRDPETARAPRTCPVIFTRNRPATGDDGKIPRDRDAGILPSDLSNKPSSRHWQGGHPGLRAAQAGPAQRARIRNHENALHAGSTDARRRITAVPRREVFADGPRYRRHPSRAARRQRLSQPPVRRRNSLVRPDRRARRCV